MKLMNVNQASPQIQVFKDDIKITATETIIAKNYYYNFYHECIRSLRLLQIQIITIISINVLEVYD